MVQPVRIEETEVLLDQFAQLVHERTGLRFNDTRRRFLLARINEAAADADCLSLQAFYDLIVSSSRDSADLFSTLVDRIVTDESSFFRYPQQFEALRHFIFPAIASNREFAGDNSLRILSAGCSRGQEPYSIAMTVLDEGETLKGLDTTIYSLDLSQSVLDAARAGIYLESQLRDIRPALRDRYFTPVENGSRPKAFQVRSNVRNLVRFQQHNLMNDLAGPIFDIVFCRNVTIYFDVETTRRVARNLYDRLRPGGYLFLGHAESYYGILPELTIVQFGETLVNRKPVR